MNDNDIIKAIEYCFDEDAPCEGCPMFNNRFCKTELLKSALNLINRQKAEIERLTGYNENLIAANSDITNKLWDEVEEAKTEAIKECAEKTDVIITEIYNKFIFGDYDLGDEAKAAVMDFVLAFRASYHIDNLVKEMTEDEDDRAG